VQQPRGISSPDPMLTAKGAQDDVIRGFELKTTMSSSSIKRAGAADQAIRRMPRRRGHSKFYDDGTLRPTWNAGW
jgi:hypothetical protein